MKLLLCAIVVVVLAGAGFYVVETNHPAVSSAAASQASYEVTLRFDGGYAFIDNARDKSLTIASFHAPGETASMIEAHQMHLRRQIGHQEKGPRPDAALDTWNLSDHPYDVSVANFQTTPQVLKLPDETAIAPDKACDPIAEYSAAADNLTLMPSMDRIGQLGGFPAAVDLTRSKYHNRVVLTGGTMHIIKTTSCFEFMKGGESLKHRFVSGIDGVIVRFRLTGNLSLTVTNADTNTPVTYEFSPEVSQASGDREVQLWFGRFPPPCTASDPGCYLGKDAELVDFRRFYYLLANPLAEGNQLVPVNRSDTGDVTPRTQCPGVRFKVS